ELVRDLHEDAGAVAGARVGADGAAMLEVFENLQAVFNDLVRLAPLDVGDEADAAGVALEARVVHAAGGRQARIETANGFGLAGPARAVQTIPCRRLVRLL